MNKIHIIRIAIVAVIAALGLSLTGCGEHAEPLEFEVPGNAGPR
jgi:hypothetical protein